MGKRIEIVRTEDCPCQGTHGWKWHKSRGISPCEYSQRTKHANLQRWEDNVRIKEGLRYEVLKEDPSRIPWVAGAPIYVDEEERPG